jgi:hypothetical protein
MKKILIIGLIFLSSISTYSQLNTKNISFELRYPIPFGDNFINKGFGNGYLGLIDFGFDYNIIKINGLGIGILLNSSFLRLSETDLTLMILSPKIKVEYEIDLNKISIIPQVGIGYSNWRFRAPEMTYYDELGDPVHGEKFKQNENGLSIKGATKIVINNNNRIKWYFNLSYEFTKLEKPEQDGGDKKFNRNIHLIYPGIGMIWNFGE